MALYDNVRDLANHFVAHEQGRHDLPDVQAVRFGMVDAHESIFRKDPEHSEFLYASLLRPLGGWFGPGQEHTPIASGRGWGIVGTSEPFPIDTLSGFELIPMDATSRAASVLRSVLGEDGEHIPTLASVEGELAPERVHIFMPVPEHEGDYSLVTFDEDGPWGHRCYYTGNPYDSSSASLLSGIQDLLQGDREMISASIADAIVSDWCENEDLLQVE